VRRGQGLHVPSELRLPRNGRGPVMRVTRTSASIRS
jgi:hypothetical protein